MSNLIFIFIDGVGCGQKTVNNPFWESKSQFLRFYSATQLDCNLWSYKPLPLEIYPDQLPNSALYQTALFCGLSPLQLPADNLSFPNRQLRATIIESNLLKKIIEKEKKAAFLNAYPFHGELFTSPHLTLSKNGELDFSEKFPCSLQRKISVTTCMLLSIGQKPFDENDLIAGRALYHDFSNSTLLKHGADLPFFSPEEAGKILAEASENFDLLLYEYFLTDLIGHQQNRQKAIELITNLDRFLNALFSALSPQKTTVLITSDHGNLEDLSISTHTFNPVPLLVWGKLRSTLLAEIGTQAAVVPAIIKHLS